MTTPMQKARGLYAELITTLAASGRGEEAQECARLAVGQGLWAHPFQRPLDYVPSLPAVPCYDRRRFWVVKHLEEHYPVIRAEFDRVADSARGGFSPVEEPLLSVGRWDQVVFYEGGQRFERANALFPATAAVLEAIPEEVRSAGVVMLSWLHPQSHIVPHCGHTNARLRIHLGVRTPPGASLRVHDRVLTWKEGECLVFDDSFEHEVWHRGDEPRVILLFDIFHPALSQAEKEERLKQASAPSADRAREFMQQRGFRRVEREGEHGLRVELDPSSELLLLRYMREGGIRAVELSDDAGVSLSLGPPTVGGVEP